MSGICWHIKLLLVNSLRSCWSAGLAKKERDKKLEVHVRRWKQDFDFEDKSGSQRTRHNTGCARCQRWWRVKPVKFWWLTVTEMTLTPWSPLAGEILFISSPAAALVVTLGLRRKRARRQSCQAHKMLIHTISCMGYMYVTLTTLPQNNQCEIVYWGVVSQSPDNNNVS